MRCPLGINGQDADVGDAFARDRAAGRCWHRSKPAGELGCRYGRLWLDAANMLHRKEMRLWPSACNGMPSTRIVVGDTGYWLGGAGGGAMFWQTNSYWPKLPPRASTLMMTGCSSTAVQAR